MLQLKYNSSIIWEKRTCDAPQYTGQGCCQFDTMMDTVVLVTSTVTSNRNKHQFHLRFQWECSKKKEKGQ